MKLPVSVEKNKRYFATLLFLGVINLIVFFSKTHGAFLADDFSILLKVSAFDLSTSNIISLGISQPVGIYYRPIPLTVWLVLYKLFGMAPGWYHATILLFHIVNAIFVYSLFRRLFSENFALACASIFSVFTGNLEALQWLSGFFDVICAMFFLASLLLISIFLEKKRILLYIGALFFAVCAILSKEMAITLPGFVFVLSMIWFSRDDFRPRSLLPSFLLSLPFGILYLLYLFIRSRLLLRYGIQTSPVASISDPRLWSKYSDVFGKLVWPEAKMISDLSDTASTILLVGVCVFALVAVGFFYLKKDSRRPLILGAIWIVAASFPPVLFQRNYFERFNYIPGIGFCLILAGILTIRPKSPRWQKLALTAPCAAVLFYSVNTIIHNKQWINAWRTSNKIQERFVSDVSPSLAAPAKVYLRLPDFVEGIFVFYTGVDECFNLLKNENGFTYYKLGETVYTDFRLNDIYQKYGYYWYDWDTSTDHFLQVCAPYRNPEPFNPNKNLIAAWKFSEEADYSKWRPGEGISVNMRKGAASPEFIVFGDPGLLEGPEIVEKIKYFQVVFRAINPMTSLSVAQLFWINDEGESYTPQNSIRFPVKLDAEYHTYTIPLFVNPWRADEPILRFRLNPSMHKGSRIEIQSISVYSG